MKRLSTILGQPFRSEFRIDIRLVSVFIFINGLVLTNAYLHDPRIGYDNDGYFPYIETLSTSHLVTPQDSREFFSPPLPFVFPALLMAQTGMDVPQAVKFGQFLNVLLSLGLTWYLLKACALIESHVSLRLGTLVFLGILPVYYKSFAFLRGEPFVAFFTVLILYYALKMIVRREFTPTNACILGLSMGLSALSRQWGLLLFPSVFLLLIYYWIRLPRRRNSIAKATGICFIIAFIVGGWFYVFLRFRQGTYLAFNRGSAPSFALSNQPLSFYIGTTPGLLFRRPFRPAFTNEFIPILYSEIWGDYWGYFSVASRDARSLNHINGKDLAAILDIGIRPNWLETNYDTMVAYLGNVNIASIFPSALALISIGLVATTIVRGRGNMAAFSDQWEIQGFILLAIGTIMAGYFWFLIMYPHIGKGDTIKATYLLHVFPLVALLVGVVLEKVQARSRLLFSLLLIGLCIVVVHNFSAMMTHY